MGVLGTLLRKRRAGEARLAWNLPNLCGPDALAVTSAGFADGAAMPAVHASKWIGGRELSPRRCCPAGPCGAAMPSRCAEPWRI